MATNNVEKNTNNINYAIPRKVQVTDKPSGGIKRLTVAVVVDGYYKKGEGANAVEVFTPRPEEELRRFRIWWPMRLALMSNEETALP